MTVNLPTPENRRFYTLQEAVVHYKSSGIKSPKYFFNLTNKGSSRKILCAYATCSRHFRRYIHDEVLPPIVSDGITEGRPRLIPDNEITSLNNSLLEHVGKTENMENLLMLLLN